jgi:anti-anti-sigma factor
MGIARHDNGRVSGVVSVMKAGETPPPGQDPASLLKQEGASMPGTDLSTRDCDGHVIVVLSGELDMLDAALVTDGLMAAMAREPQVIVDLAGLEFIDCSGITVLARGRKLARDAGGELRLAAPRPQVLRVLTVTGLTGVIPVHASVAEAAAMAALSLQARATGPAPRPRHPAPAGATSR